PEDRSAPRAPLAGLVGSRSTAPSVGIRERTGARDAVRGGLPCAANDGIDPGGTAVRRFMLGAVTLVVLVGAGVGAYLAETAASNKLPLKHLSCAGPVTQSLRLADDVGPNCTGVGLRILKSGITLDLNGHTVDGNDNNNPGIDSNGFDHVTIENGTISDF